MTQLDRHDAVEIGRRLKRLREEAGLSQRALAGPGVTAAFISRLEKGDRAASARTLRFIAAKLGVTPHYLETGRNSGTCPHCGSRL